MEASLSSCYEIAMYSTFRASTNSKAVAIVKNNMEQHAGVFAQLVLLVKTRSIEWWVQSKSTKARQALSINPLLPDDVFTWYETACA